MRVVLFLGAGFSSAFGHPVMSQFLTTVDASPNISNQDKQLVQELTLEARRANSFLESSPTNLEDILSFAVMGDRLEMRGATSPRSRRLLKILQRVYTNIERPQDYWKRYDNFWSFLGRDTLSDMKGDTLSVVTTNYDLNVESALRARGSAADLGVTVRQIADDRQWNGNVFYRDGGVPLFKLHGSVNWFVRSRPKNEIDVEARIARTQMVFDAPHGLELPLVCMSDYKSELTPIIVPPSFLKPDLVGPLKSIWAGAASALGQAHVLIFVGYSFPPSDTDMMYFLARSLVGNPHLQAIHVVDVNANAIVARLKSPGSRFGSHFRDMLTPHQAPWQAWRLRGGDVEKLGG